MTDTTAPARLGALALLVALAAPLAAQQTPAAPLPEATQPAPIADNSFLVEEAYNQETGVVQHVGAYRRDRAGAWLFTFTQEWPFPSQRHQLSYTLPLQTGSGSGSGLGDVALNYRLQALGREGAPVWFSPRVSVVLPTGVVRRGLGAGGPGLQLNLPVSVLVDESLVTHWNLGAAVTRARTEGGIRASARALTAAASAIWLLSPTFNLMLEGAWDRTETLGALGGREAATHFVLVPGVRGAINLASGMQIVPGVGIPIGLGPSRDERDLFLYLSIEHAFR